VIDSFWAVVTFGDDTAAVVPENIVTSSNSNVDWLLLDTGQVFSRSLSLSVRGHFSDTLTFVISACGFFAGITRSVGVVTFEHLFVGLEPVVSPEVPATATAIVTSNGREGAVDKLLRRHDSFIVASDHPSGLNGLDGRESPAGTA